MDLQLTKHRFIFLEQPILPSSQKNKSTFLAIKISHFRGFILNMADFSEAVSFIFI